MKNIDYIKETIRSVQDFPKQGINFQDITPLFQQPNLINDIIENFVEYLKNKHIDCIAGIESRGFLFGLPLALRMNLPFVLIRKPNKLPRETYKQEISLEYGNSCIELQKGDIKPNWNVAIIDDLLATGGTVSGAEKLIKQSNANPITSLFLIELEKIGGRNKLESEVYSILKY